MIRPLLKHDIRKTLPYYPGIMGALVALLLITNDVLDATNIFAVVLGVVQGWMLAYCIFRDPGHTDAFLFSRPFARKHIFWNRWALGMSLQAMTLLVVYVLLATGVRMRLHEGHMPQYPMIQPFELAVLWPIGLSSVISFQVVMFLIVHSHLSSPDASSGMSKTWKRFVVKLACLLILMVFISGPIVLRAGMSEPSLRIGTGAIIYAALLIVLGTAASLKGYENMEIGK